jgi:hypothetical protein
MAGTRIPKETPPSVDAFLAISVTFAPICFLKGGTNIIVTFGDLEPFVKCAQR